MNARVPPDRISREETIVNAAVELSDPAKRAAYLEMACDGDPALRARLAIQSAAGPAHSKTWRKRARLWPTLQRLGVRRSSAAFGGARALGIRAVHGKPSRPIRRALGP